MPLVILKVCYFCIKIVTEYTEYHLFHYCKVLQNMLVPSEDWKHYLLLGGNPILPFLTKIGNTSFWGLFNSFPKLYTGVLAKYILFQSLIHFFKVKVKKHDLL